MTVSLFSLLLLAWFPSLSQGTPVTAQVYYVVDGDTLRIMVAHTKESLRLLGVDTPEKEGPYTHQEPFGKKATARTKELEEGKKVTLLFEGETLRDRYGRLLAHVILPDGRSLGEILLAEGLATAYRKFSYSHKEKYRVLENEARKKCKGLWAKKRHCHDSL